MKRFFVLLLLPSIVFSQTAHTMFKVTKDKFTDAEISELIYPLVLSKGSGKCYLNLIKSADGVSTMSLQVADNHFGCTFAGDRSIYFLSSNGSKYKAFNDSKGCKGTNILVLHKGAVENEHLSDFLRVNDITSIRIENDKGNYDIDLTNTQSLQLRKASMELFGDPNASIPKLAIPRTAAKAEDDHP